MRNLRYQAIFIPVLKKRSVTISLIILASLLISTVPYLLLEHKCSITALPPSEIKKSNTDKGTEGGKPSQQAPKIQEIHPFNPLIFVNASQAEENTEHGANTANGAGEKPSDWGREFWCGVKATDVAIALLTLYLAAFTGGLWWSTHRLWKAGEKQFGLTENAFLTAQRPWVSIESPRVVSDLSWEEKGVRTAIDLLIKNVGNDPAFNVAVRSTQFVMGRDHHDVRAELDKFCTETKAREGGVNASGDILFPDQTIPQSINVMIFKEDAERAAEDLGMKVYTPVVLICVCYQSAVTQKQHATGLAFFILQKQEKSDLPKVLMLYDDMSEQAIGLARWPIGSFAD